jgi:hypothetical protein
LAFYDFPTEHWRHLRTSNLIESTFATIRLRHRHTEGSGSRLASLTMMFKLAESAAKNGACSAAMHYYPTSSAESSSITVTASTEPPPNSNGTIHIN